MTTRAKLRSLASALMLLWPLTAAVGLWLEDQHPGTGWNERVLLGMLASAGLAVVLVVGGGPSPVTDKQSVANSAAKILGAAMLAAPVVLAFSLEDCLETHLARLVAVVVLLGSLVWPWVLLAAPTRGTRWLIGPTAGAYLLLATLCVAILVDPGGGDCGR